MQLLGIIVGAFAPGIFWLWLIYRWDRYHPEPRWLVIRTFLWGIAAVLPIAVIELLLELAGGDNLQDLIAGNLTLSSSAYQAFVVAGFTEELGKFLVVRLSIYRSPYFDEATDGMVYSAAAALGFATLENIGYMVSYGLDVILIRGPISTFAHVLFSVVWGYPLGLRKIKAKGATFFVVLGLLGAMVAHGAFDFFLFTQSWYAALIFPLLASLGLALYFMLRHANRISPYRQKVAELRVECPNCRAKIPPYANYCPVCGVRLDKKDLKGGTVCGNCGQPLPPNARYCTACGSRVVDKPWQKEKD